MTTGVRGAPEESFAGGGILGKVDQRRRHVRSSQAAVY